MKNLITALRVPLDLGDEEVTVEQIDGEYHLRCFSRCNGNLEELADMILDPSEILLLMEALSRIQHLPQKGIAA